MAGMGDERCRFLTECTIRNPLRNFGAGPLARHGTYSKEIASTYLSLSIFRAAQGEERGWPRREKGEREERSGGVGPRRSHPTTQLPFWANVPLTASLQATMPFPGIFIRNFLFFIFNNVDHRRTGSKDWHRNGCHAIFSQFYT